VAEILNPFGKKVLLLMRLLVSIVLMFSLPSLLLFHLVGLPSLSSCCVLSFSPSGLVPPLASILGQFERLPAVNLGKDLDNSSCWVLSAQISSSSASICQILQVGILICLDPGSPLGHPLAWVV
jgi:hypothetical protein